LTCGTKGTANALTGGGWDPAKKKEEGAKENKTAYRARKKGTGGEEENGRNNDWGEG